MTLFASTSTQTLLLKFPLDQEGTLQVAGPKPRAPGCPRCHRWPLEIRGLHHGLEQGRMSGHTVSISPVSIDKVQRHCNPTGHQTGKHIPLLRTLESSRSPSKEHWEWGGRNTLFPAGSSSARIRFATPECGLFTTKNKRQWKPPIMESQAGLGSNPGLATYPLCDRGHSALV